MRIGSLCAGYGGLTLATHEVYGGRLAWYSEIDPAACKVLAARFPGVPNIGDMTTVDWGDVEPVDLLDGGTPCQDLSHAGGRAGMRTGTRSGLWSAMVDAIDVLRPQRVIWENVRGAFSAGADSDMEPCPGCVGDGSGDVLRAFGRVLGDLADSGYDAGWCGLPASAVGAPHARYRAFVAAHPRGETGPLRSGLCPSEPGGERGGRPHHSGFQDAPDSGGAGPQEPDSLASGLQAQLTAPNSPVTADSDRDPVREQPVALAGGSGQTEPGLTVPAPDSDRGAPPDTPSNGRHERRPKPAGELGGSDVAVGCADPAADSDCGGLESVGRVEPVERDTHGRGGPVIAWGPYEPAIRRWEAVTERLAPAPTALAPRGGQRLNPAFVEWMMGLPAGWVTDVPGITRNDMLKMLGNGVVPQQAAAAIRHLEEVT